MREAKFLGPTDDATTVFGAGDEYRFLAVGDETDGTYFMVEAIVPPGGGPPPHIQTREEEGFYILEGCVTFWLEDVRREAESGTFLHVPKRARHCFKNESDTDARMLFWFSPAGIEGMFEAMGEMSEDDGMERVMAIAAEYGVEFVEMATP